MVAECCNWFDVPVTVTEYVPAGVPGFFGVLLPPPQETAGSARQISRAQQAAENANCWRFARANIAATARAASKLSQSARIGPVGSDGPAKGNTADGAVVEIVRVEVAVPEPGVTLAGEKLQVASDGRPEHASETESVKPTPPCGAMEIA